MIKTVIEYLPLVAFFAIYKLVDIYWATASLIATSALQIGYHYVVDKHVQKRHIIFFVVALVMGTLTIAFRDDTFIKWKVTVVNLLLALGIIISHVFFKKNPMEAMLGKELVLPKAIWNRLAWSWAGFFTFCAALNIYVAYNFDQETWVNFKVFGLLGLTLVFTVVTMAMVFPHMPKESDEPKAALDEATNSDKQANTQENNKG